MTARHFVLPTVREMTPADRAAQARLVRRAQLITPPRSNEWELPTFQRSAHRGNC